MKGNNKILLVFILLYFLIQIIMNVILFIKVDEYTSPRQITAQASGQVGFCKNRPPEINFTCNHTVYQDENYYCRVNATDDPGEIITFDSDFMPPPDLFDISSTGIIDFTPNASQIGFFQYRIIVWGNSNCGSVLDVDLSNLTVINVNDPPRLIQPIPNQTWQQDTVLSPFDLDNYFWDPDGDPINYTNILLTNINVQIDTNNIVTFTPIVGWYGTESIIFYAWDPYFANGSSNNITLLVTRISTPQEPVPPRSQSGGGGGGGTLPECIPRWYCRPWGPCEPDNLMRRECYDLNNCSSLLGKPNLTQECVFVSTCYDGFKGPDEEDIDCGGPCPPCGTCYDNLCNNEEDCTKGLINIPDCGGPCIACNYQMNETCYDNVCNNNEDCTKGLSEIPDCGGPCDRCPILENPIIVKAFNWGLLVLLILMAILAAYMIKKTYPSLVLFAKKKKKKYYEERLLLEATVSESIFDSLIKLEKLLSTENIEKLILMFSTIIRRYFKSLFNLKYEFTYEELETEIQARNINPTLKSVLKTFFERSIEIEFSGKSVTRQELEAMISEFKQIVSYTSAGPLMISEEIKRMKPKAITKVDLLFVKISEAETSLMRGDLNGAYFKYLRLVHDFNYLPENERRRLHGFMARLYDEIKLAREKYEYEQAKHIPLS